MFARTALVAALLAAPAAAQDPVAAWAGRRSVTPAVRYAVRWEPAAGWAPGAGRTETLVLDLAGGRLRADGDVLTRDRNRPESLSRRRSSVRFDGREQSGYHVIDSDAATAPPEPLVTDVFVAPWERATMRWPMELDPLLWAHGLFPHWSVAPRALPFNQPADPARFTAAGVEVVDGRACAVLKSAPDRTGSVRTVWVDAARGGAVVRHRDDWPGADGEPGFSTETTVTYQETARGWLPSGWAETRIRPGQPAKELRRVRVESVAFDPPADADFRVTPPTGARVETPGQDYRVAADGTPEPIPYPTGNRPPGVLRRMRDAAADTGWAGVAGVAVAVGLTGVLVRLRRRAGSRTTGQNSGSALLS